MIDPRYLKILFIAFISCAVIVSLFWMKGETIDYRWIFSSFIFGALFVSLVVIRLPIFKEYYRPKTHAFECRKHGYANQKAAPVMSSLITGGAIAAILCFFDVANILAPVFTGALSAGIVSFYHAPKF